MKLLLLTLLISVQLLSSHLLKADTGFETITFGQWQTNMGGIHYKIVSASQVSDEIHVFGTHWFDGGPLQPTPVLSVASVQVKGSSIVAQYQGTSFEEAEGEPETDNDLEVQSFDFAIGDGWVDSMSIGWIHMHLYPWVWSVELGWLYVMEGPVSYVPLDAVQLEFDPTTGLYEAIVDKAYLPSLTSINAGMAGNSHYLWSEQNGWLFKSVLSDYFWVYNMQDWLYLYQESPHT